ncbi:MAG: alpha hydrolase [Halobacteriaceae archaeon]
MRLGLLCSGGKDSTLAALLCREFYDVTLVTVHFGVTDGWTVGGEVAAAVGVPFRPLPLDVDVAETAADRIVADGYPRHGIQSVHVAALEAVAAMGFDAVADGTRRDDRVPTVSRAQAQSLEDRHGVDYVAPLSGFGRGAVDALAADALVVESGPSERLRKADYETELRALVRKRHGEGAVAEAFPDHEQTRVVGLR